MCKFLDYMRSKNQNIKLEALQVELSVCKVAAFTPEMLLHPFTFTATTDEECSLVCPMQNKPAETIACEDGWRAFRVVGVLDFSLIGILSQLSSLLAEAKIGIFAISTYNTDYILVKQENWEKALGVLKDYYEI